MSTALNKPTFLLSGLVLSVLIFLITLLTAELYPAWSKTLLLVSAVVTFASCWFCYQLRESSHRKTLFKIVVGGLVFTSILLLAHFVVNVSNIYQYEPLPNWFYTLKLFRLITLSGVFWTQLVVLLLGMLFSLSAPKQQLKFGMPVVSLFIVLVIPVYVHFQQALAFAYAQAIQMSLNVQIPFDDRFTYKQGGTTYYGWIWPYSQFLIKHTPENAVLVIPPQNNIWKMEGNEAYFRWFMYPRKLISLQDGQIPDQTTHLLIALGECDNGDCGWPKISIPAEHISKIILIDRETQEEVILENTPYNLDTYRFKWGIIELQKLD